MTLDKFGRSIKRSKLERGPPGLRGKDGEAGIGFLLTSDKNYDLQMKSIKNLQSPKEDDDAVNKKYVDDVYKNFMDLSHSYIESQIVNINSRIAGYIKEIYEHMETSLLKHRAECDKLITDLNTDVIKYVDIKVDNINTTLQGISGLEAIVFAKNENPQQQKENK